LLLLTGWAIFQQMACVSVRYLESEHIQCSAHWREEGVSVSVSVSVSVPLPLPLPRPQSRRAHSKQFLFHKPENDSYLVPLLHQAQAQTALSLQRESMMFHQGVH